MKKTMSNAIVRNIGHFDNAMDLASMEGLEGMKGDNVKPQRIVSSSSLATVWLCRLQADEIDLTSSEGLEGMKVQNIKLLKILSLSVSHGVIADRNDQIGRTKMCANRISVK